MNYSDEVRQIVAAVEARLDKQRPPLIVAIDGRSGVGKSTIAAELSRAVHAVVIDQDDFYSGGTLAEWSVLSAEQKVVRIIDWQRLRTEVLEPLRAGRRATWHPFDWTDMAGVSAEKVVADPAPCIILEGTYSSSPELADLCDLSVLIRLGEGERRRRLREREGEELSSPWQRIWDEAEDYYFSQMRSPDMFDIVIERPTS